MNNRNGKETQFGITSKLKKQKKKTRPTLKENNPSSKYHHARKERNRNIHWAGSESQWYPATAPEDIPQATDSSAAAGPQYYYRERRKSSLCPAQWTCSSAASAYWPPQAFSKPTHHHHLLSHQRMAPHLHSSLENTEKEKDF